MPRQPHPHPTGLPETGAEPAPESLISPSAASAEPAHVPDGLWHKLKPMVLAGASVGALGGIVLLALSPKPPPPMPVVDTRPLEENILNLQRDTQQLRAELAQLAAQPDSVAPEQIQRLERQLRDVQHTQHIPSVLLHWLLLEALWHRAASGQPFTDLLALASTLFTSEAMTTLNAASAGLITPIAILHGTLAVENKPAAASKTFFGSLITITRTPAARVTEAATPDLSAALLSGDEARITEALAGTPWQERWQQRLSVLTLIRQAQQSLKP